MQKESLSSFYSIHPFSASDRTERAKYYTQPLCGHLEGRYNKLVLQDTSILNTKGEIIQQNGIVAARFYQGKVLNLENWHEEVPTAPMLILVKDPYHYKQQKQQGNYLGETNGLVLWQNTVFAAKPSIVYQDSFQVMRPVRNDSLIASFTYDLERLNYQELFVQKLQVLQEQLQQQAIPVAVWNYTEYQSPN